ncbi:14324_t:CDS:2, partial [Ambispora leptoticha]
MRKVQTPGTIAAVWLSSCFYFYYILFRKKAIKEKRIHLVISTFEPLFNFTDIETLENLTIHRSVMKNQQQMVITTPPAEEEEEFCFP